MIVMGVAVGGGTFYANKLLHEAAQIVPSLPEKMDEVASLPSEIVSADGKVLFTLQSEFRKPVTIDQVPQKVISTTLAAEDIRFYTHTGVDMIAIGRIVVEALKAGGQAGSGGSTLTMQLAKRVYTSPEKTMERKFKDMALAIEMEKMLTKDQILELYLNQVYYGAGAYGINAAAATYFNKSLDQLTLSEAAMLARCVRRPSDENPFADLKKARANRDIVLDTLYKEKLIGEAEYKAAINEPIKLAAKQPIKKTGIALKRCPHFVDYILKQIKVNMPDIDLSKGGYRVETTIDTRIQGAAMEELNESVRRYRGMGVRTGAFVCLGRDGQILAMVGSPDYNKSEFNAVTQGRRQPGSSFKPFVYATGFHFGALSGPYSTVDNGEAYKGGGKSVKGGGPMGGVSVMSALTYSYNRAAWNTLKRVGANNVVRLCHSEFGFKSDLGATPALSLGAYEVTPLEMAQAYSVFQNRGYRADAYGIKRITGPNGLPVYVADSDLKKTDISEATADKIDACLRGVVNNGTGEAASNVTNARGKTGTTNDNHDAWFCGYTDQLIGVVWFANPVDLGKGRIKYMEMDNGAMGGKISAPTWSRIMRRIQGFVDEKPIEVRKTFRRAEPEEEEMPEDKTIKDPPINDNIPTIDPDGKPLTDKPVNPVNPDAPAGTTAGDPAGAGGISPVNPPKQDPPKTDPPKNDPPVKHDPPADDYETVEICADSGQRATSSCPERVSRRYKKGQAPRGRCPIHG